jgi:hypothetical protein
LLANADDKLALLAPQSIQREAPLLDGLSANSAQDVDR